MVLEEKDVKKFEQMLIEQKEKLEADLERIAKPTSKEGDYETRYQDIGDDMDENASEVEEYVGNIAIENNLEEQFTHSRVDCIAYEVCIQCLQKRSARQDLSCHCCRVGHTGAS